MNRHVRPWPWPVPAILLLLLPLGVGCDITPDPEEEFQLQGVLSQATADTTTTDHFRAAVSPDGTRILFITDAYADGKQEDPDDIPGSDFVLVDMPAPGVFPPLVNNVSLNPGWTRINLGQIPDDSGSNFNPFRSVKGEATWMLDGNRFVAVIENPDGNSRLYLLELGPDDGSGQISLVSAELIDDVDFASVGNRNSYHYLSPSVSPDGEWVAYARYYYRAAIESSGIPTDAEYMAIHAYNFSSGETVRVTNGSTLEQDPAWSPDGSQIVFTAQFGEVGTRDLVKVDFDPTQDADVRDWVPWEDGGQTQPFTDGRVRLTTTAGFEDWKLPVGSFNPTWMSDGRIVFTSTRRAPGASERVRNIWAIGPSGGEPRLLFFSRWDDSQPSTANYVNASSDARSLIVFTTRLNRSADFLDQKQDLWVLRGF